MEQHRASDQAATRDDVLDPTGVLTELARLVDASPTFEDALDNLVALAKRRIPGADEVSLTMVARDKPSTLASTGVMATDLDERQYANGWGPCIDAAVSGELLLIDDATTDTRWPEYAPRAAEAGMGSSMSVAVPVSPNIAAALNVYSRTPHAFGADSQTIGKSFAAHAALTLSRMRSYTDAVREAQTLQEAMRSRATIEQAKGILMAARRCDATEAFDVLVRLSQTRHVKLREVAADLVAEASGQVISPDEV